MPLIEVNTKNVHPRRLEALMVYLNDNLWEWKIWRDEDYVEQ